MIDNVTFVLLDEAAIVAKLASAGSIRLRRLIVRIGALYFVSTVKSYAFSSSSLVYIVCPRSV
jgi:hypothetical protein